jgi:hypothetical protein
VPNFTIRPYADELRRQGGWKRAYESRAGGVRLVAFEKWVNSRRKLELQLWADGRHRVTFMWYTTKTRDRMSTSPSDFESVTGMITAIAAETRRKPAPRH